MKRIKRWLTERFLPVYLKEELLKDNERLREENRELRIHIRELNAYASGLEFGIRHQRKLVINNRIPEQPSVFIPDPNHSQPEEVSK